MRIAAKGSSMRTIVESAGTSWRPLKMPARWRNVSIAVSGFALCGLATAFVAVRAPAGEAVGRAVIEALTIGAPMAAGLVALRSPRNATFGVMLIGTALFYSLTALGEASGSLAFSIGRVAAWLLFPFMLFLLLAFPDGRLGPGVERKLFAALIALIGALYVGSALFVERYPTHTPWATCDGDCPPNAFLVLDSEPAVMKDVVQPLRESLAIVLVSAVAGSLVRRWRTATPLRRSLMGPVVVAGALWIAALVAFYLVRRAAPDSHAAEVVGLVWSLCLAGVAVAFLVGLLRRQLLLGRVLAHLSSLLSGPIDVRRMRDGLSRALRDPSLQVLTKERGRWRDADGRMVAEPEAGRGQQLTLIRDDDAPALALVHDADLSDHELVEAAGSLVLAGLRHERARSNLAASLDQLEASRRRIARSADLERSRIERDLHDGAQQRLIALRLRLSSAEELVRADPDGAAASMHELGDEVERAIDELRDLAHGVYPSLLGSLGLVHALRSLAAQSPLPVHLRVERVTRQAPEIETAVYFTCAEALQNAIKHAPDATGVWITVCQQHALTLEIRDDGPGFDAATVKSHGGLRNMRDRLEAVGGGLTLDTAPGHGARLLGFVTLDSG
jgi:signal transduction histidine kinase